MAQRHLCMGVAAEEVEAAVAVGEEVAAVLAEAEERGQAEAGGCRGLLLQ